MTATNVVKSNLQSDPLFLGLTRPPMIFGVSYLYFMFTLCLTMIAYINTKLVILPLLLYPSLHLLGYFLCMRDPRSVELFMTKAGKTSVCKNKTFHHYTNSYDLF